MLIPSNSSNGGKGLAGRKWFLLALVIVIQLACWRGTSKLKTSRSISSITANQSIKEALHTQDWIHPKELVKRDGTVISSKDGDGKRLTFEMDLGSEEVDEEDQVGSMETDSQIRDENKEDKEKKKKKKGDKKKERKKKKKKEKKEKKDGKHKSTSTLSTSSTTSSSTTSTSTTSKEKPTTTSKTSTTSNSSSSTSSGTGLPTSTPIPILPCDPLPLQLSPAKLCAHVRQHCPPSGHFDYLGFFYCQGVEPKKDPDSETSSDSKADYFSSSTSTSSILSRFQSSTTNLDLDIDSFDNLSNLTFNSEDDYNSIFTIQKHKKGVGKPYPISRKISILRSLALATIIAWMLFLFSGVGIVASDFFCPNLSTIASRLGLNESTAGVTFLAFGNGSPDVFSTFGAMKSGSGSLAIGELLGAASFIVSVISGSMMLIKPFRVKAFPFLRDVGFFTVAVAVTMAFLLDGKLRLIESLCLIGLYFAYATTIIVGSWWQERRRRKLLMIATARSEYSINARSRTELEEDEEDEIINPFRDDEDQDQKPILKTPSKHKRSISKAGSSEDLERQTTGLLSVPSPYLAPLSPSSEYDPDADPLELWADTPSAGLRAVAGIASAVGAPTTSPVGSPRLGPSPLGSISPGGRGDNQLSNLGMMRSQSRFRPGANPRHSLLGAIEFRDVVRSLRAESNYTEADDRSLEVFQSRDPESFYPHHHNHPHHHHQHQHQHQTQTQTRPRHQRSETHTHRRISSLAPESALEPSSAYEYLSTRDRSYSTGSRNGRPQVIRSKSTGSNLRTVENGDEYFSTYHSNAIGSSSGSGSGEVSGFASLAGSRERDAAAGTDGQSKALDIGAATVGLDDPWREDHAVDDNCQEAVVPSSTKPSNLNNNKTKADELRLGLPKIGTHRRNISEEFLLPPSVEQSSDHVRSPVPSIKISKSVGSDEESSPPGTPTPQPKSKKQSEFNQRSRSSSNATSSKFNSSKVRTTSESIRRHLKMGRRALFPSLRHFREKSWLGIVVSILTAPALFALNLTLPVVDDEAEKQLSLVAAEGELRLGGSESDLNATKAFQEEEDHDDERIIQLGGDEESHPKITYNTLAKHQDQLERVHKAENSERDREIANALGKIPLGENPLTLSKNKNRNSYNVSKNSSQSNLQQVNEEGEEDRESNFSNDSCSTSNSIFGEVASPANSELFPIQCILAPPFCTWAIISSSGASEKSVRNKVLLAFFFGSSLALFSFFATLRARKLGGNWLSKRNLVLAGNVRCGIGFIVSVMWIMTIVDEVVSILQTIGIIVGLSDAILGLTVFAIGNSLGDLVANVTIAKMGHPVMAISACFAGPLLNLLLGIGISGSWILSRPTSSSHPIMLEGGIYHIDFSPTLIVSGLGLLTILVGTLIAVPMNGFLLSRKLGTTLIGAYACIMVTNILVEVFYGNE